MGAADGCAGLATCTWARVAATLAMIHDTAESSRAIILAVLGEQPGEGREDGGERGVGDEITRGNEEDMGVER